jgi:hypothetical protein
MHKNQGGDRGKGPNVTGTLPKKRRADAPGEKPGRKDVKGGVGRRRGPKHAAQRSGGQKSSVTRKAGPKKTRRGTTTRSGDK